jgi:hypothetical protein
LLKRNALGDTLLITGTHACTTGVAYAGDLLIDLAITIVIEAITALNRGVIAHLSVIWLLKRSP